MLLRSRSSCAIAYMKSQPHLCAVMSCILNFLMRSERSKSRRIREGCQISLGSTKEQPNLLPLKLTWSTKQFKGVTQNFSTLVKNTEERSDYSKTLLLRGGAKAI